MNRSLLIPLLAAMLMGCGSTVKAPHEGRHDPYAPGQWSFSSRILEENTAVSTPVATRDDTGNILHVTFTIRSTSNQDMYLDYRVTFFDKNGQAITDYSWATRKMTRNIPENIRVASGTAKAADFHIDFREAQ